MHPLQPLPRRSQEMRNSIVGREKIVRQKITHTTKLSRKISIHTRNAGDQLMFTLHHVPSNKTILLTKQDLMTLSSIIPNLIKAGNEMVDATTTDPNKNRDCCNVCLDRYKNVVTIPCMHYSLCNNCAMLLYPDGHYENSCVICRSTADSYVIVYPS